MEGSRVEINIVCSCGSELSYSGVLDNASEKIVERWMDVHARCAEWVIEEGIDESASGPLFFFSCAGAEAGP